MGPERVTVVEDKDCFKKLTGRQIQFTSYYCVHLNKIRIKVQCVETP